MNSNTHFLIVDDYENIRTLVKNQLNELGIENITDFDNAIDALAYLNEEGSSVEFIISDWNMPGMIGLEFLKNVRANLNYSKVPFIILTTENEQEKILAAVEAGVSNFLIKPWKFEEFAEKIASAWSLKKS